MNKSNYVRHHTGCQIVNPYQMMVFEKHYDDEPKVT